MCNNSFSFGSPLTKNSGTRKIRFASILFIARPHVVMFSYARKSLLSSPTHKGASAVDESPQNHTPSPNKHFRAVSSRNVNNFDQLRQTSPNQSSSRTRSKSINDISIGNISEIELNASGDSLRSSPSPVVVNNNSARRKSVGASPARGSPSPIKLFQATPIKSSDNHSVTSSKSGSSDNDRVSSLLLSQSEFRSVRQQQRRGSLSSFLTNFTDDLIGRDLLPSRKATAVSAPGAEKQSSTVQQRKPVAASTVIATTSQIHNPAAVVQHSNHDSNSNNNEQSEPMELEPELSTDVESSSDAHQSLNPLSEPAHLPHTTAASHMARSSADITAESGEASTDNLPVSDQNQSKEEHVLRRHRRILQMLQEYRCTVEQDHQEATRREKLLQKRIAAAVVPVYSPLERVNVAAKTLLAAEQEIVKLMHSWNAVQSSAVAHLEGCDTNLSVERTKYITVQRQLEKSEHDLVAEGEVHREAIDQLHEVVRSVAQKHGAAMVRQLLASYPASWFEGCEDILSAHTNTHVHNNMRNNTHNNLNNSANMGNRSMRAFSMSGSQADHSNTEITDTDTMNKGEYLNKVMPTGDSFQRPWSFSIDKAVVEGLQTAATVGHRFYGPPYQQHRTDGADLTGIDGGTVGTSRAGSASNSRASSRTRARSGTFSTVGTATQSAYTSYNNNHNGNNYYDQPNVSSDVSTDGHSRGHFSSGNSVASSTLNNRSTSASRLANRSQPLRSQYSQSGSQFAPQMASFAPDNDPEDAEFRHAELRNQQLISRAITKLENYRNDVRAEGVHGGRSTSPSVLKHLSQASQQAANTRLSAHSQRTSTATAESPQVVSIVHAGGSGSGQQATTAPRRASSASAASVRRHSAANTTATAASSSHKHVVQPVRHEGPSQAQQQVHSNQRVSRSLLRSPPNCAISPRYHSLYSANLFSPTTGAPIDFRSVADGNRNSRAFSGASSSDAGYSGTRYSDYMLEDLVVDETSGALKFARPVSKKLQAGNPQRESYSYIQSPSQSPVPSSLDGPDTAALLNTAPVLPDSPSSRPHSPVSVKPGGAVIVGNQWLHRSIDKSHISSSSSDHDDDAHSVRSNTVQASSALSSGGTSPRHGGLSAGKESVLRVAVPTSTLLSPAPVGQRGASPPRSKTPPPWTSTRSISAATVTPTSAARNSTSVSGNATAGSSSPTGSTSRRASASHRTVVPTSGSWEPQQRPDEQPAPNSPGSSAAGAGASSTAERRKSKKQSIPKVRVPTPSRSASLSASIANSAGAGASVGAGGGSPVNRTTVLSNQAQLTAQQEAARYIESLRRSLR